METGKSTVLGNFVSGMKQLKNVMGQGSCYFLMIRLTNSNIKKRKKCANGEVKSRDHTCQKKDI